MPMIRKNIKAYVALVSLAVASGLAFGGYQAGKYYLSLRQKQILFEKKKAAWNSLRAVLENKVQSFNGELGIVIKDLDTNWEIDFNKDTLIPSASLVKIPIMLSYFYAAQEGKISFQDRLSLKGIDRVPGSKVLGDSPRGTVFAVEELLKPMITESDNTAANALIDFLGFDTLHSYFEKLGLKNTNLSRKMMDFAKRKAGIENYTTAQEMSSLLERIYRKTFLNQEASQKCLEILSQQKVNDRIPKKLPRGVLVAHKTGLERQVCHDVGIVFTDKGNFLICVLAKHQDKFAKASKNVISDIALLTYNYYQSH